HLDIDIADVRARRDVALASRIDVHVAHVRAGVDLPSGDAIDVHVTGVRADAVALALDREHAVVERPGHVRRVEHIPVRPFDVYGTFARHDVDVAGIG